MTRTRIALTALVVGLLAWGGVAMARTGTTATELESSGDTTVYSIEDAGTVTVSFDGTALLLVDFQAARGWSASIDSETATEIEIDFQSANRHLRFKAEVEDEGVRAQVEDRTDSRVDAESDRADDDLADADVSDDDDDRSGSNSGSDDDRSGSNSGSSSDDDSDDPESDDDRSGSNSGSGGGDGRTETRTDLVAGVQTITVPGYGSITVEIAGNAVAFVSAEGADGWSANLDEANGHEVEVLFRKDGVVVEAKLEIEDGRLRLRVEFDD